MGIFSESDNRSRRVNSEGHASPLGVVYVSHMTRVVLYSSVSFEVSSEITDELLQACCDSCTTFRALQKKRQIPKHWFDVSLRHGGVQQFLHD